MGIRIEEMESFSPEELIELCSSEELAEYLACLRQMVKKMTVYETLANASGISYEQATILCKELDSVEERIRRLNEDLDPDELERLVEEERFNAVSKYYSKEVFSKHGNDAIEAKLSERIGAEQWNVLSDSSKENLVTAMLLKNQNYIQDSSSLICISFSKPVEREIRKRIFKVYREFLLDEQRRNRTAIPEGMRPRNDRYEIREEKDFTLGAISFMVGIRSSNYSVTSDNRLFVLCLEKKYAMPVNKAKEFGRYLVTFADKLVPFRNPSSHGSDVAVTRKMAGDCEVLVLGEKGLHAFLSYIM